MRCCLWSPGKCQVPHSVEFCEIIELTKFQDATRVNRHKIAISMSLTEEVFLSTSRPIMMYTAILLKLMI